MTGVIIRFNPKRHFGFILAEDPASSQPLREVFFHGTAIIGERIVYEGQTVSFELAEYQGKPVAINVGVIKDIPASAKLAQAQDALELLGSPKGGAL